MDNFGFKMDKLKNQNELKKKSLSRKIKVNMIS